MVIITFVISSCRNCRKSKRICERGIRLNFIDIQTSSSKPLTNLPPGTKLRFRDESRAIASGYTVASDKLQQTASRETLPRLGSPAPGSPILPSRLDISADHPSTSKPVQPSSRLINDLDEGLLMQVFIEKVGPWMDCLNIDKPVGKPNNAIMAILYSQATVYKYCALLCSKRSNAIQGYYGLWSEVYDAY